MTRPSLPLRMLLATLIVVAALGALAGLLQATEASLSIWERLQRLPPWLALLAASSVAALLAVTAWLLWRLFRVKKAPVHSKHADAAELAERIAQLPAERTADLSGELGELERRKQSGELFVATFGEISAGKSTLVRALSGDASLAVDVRGGTTREVSLHTGQLPDGRSIRIADVPGVNEVEGGVRAVIAREEALRAHVVLYVCEGDLGREQAAELRWLEQFAKPMVIVLNKADRYDETQRNALRARLLERFDKAVVEVSAGGKVEVERIHADGRRELVQRERPPELDALYSAIEQATRTGVAALEPARERAVLDAVQARVEDREALERERESTAIVERYARRAVLGAMAAVAPGTDLLIQGTLAIGMLRELCALHGVRVRDVDLDGFIRIAGGRLRAGATLLLAIAGNVAKAFPGVGTIGGGALHAIAYGLLFASLGRAVAESLRTHARLDQDDVLARLDKLMHEDGALRREATRFARVLLEKEGR